MIFGRDCTRFQSLLSYIGKGKYYGIKKTTEGDKYFTGRRSVIYIRSHITGNGYGER